MTFETLPLWHDPPTAFTPDRIGPIFPQVQQRHRHPLYLKSPTVQYETNSDCHDAHSLASSMTPSLSTSMMAVTNPQGAMKRRHSKANKIRNYCGEGFRKRQSRLTPFL